MNDLAYLRSEYARQKMIEGYEIEMREREVKESNSLLPEAGQQKPDGLKELAGAVVAPVSEGEINGRQ